MRYYPGLCLVGLVLGAFLLTGFGTVAQQPVAQFLDLGRFQLGSYQIGIRVDGRDERVTVNVGVEHKVENEIIPADEFQAWMLLKDGRSLTLRSRSPEKGKRPMSFRGGGEWSVLLFQFEPGDPIALVLSMGNQFQVFPITSDIPR